MNSWRALMRDIVPQDAAEPRAANWRLTDPRTARLKAFMLDLLSARYGNLNRAEPRSKPTRESCFFYHVNTLEDGTTTEGPGTWDLRGKFEQYIGDYDLQGKSVFDFGTASGFLAFSAEEAGASAVTAFDTASLYEQQRVPHEGAPWFADKLEWVRTDNPSQVRMQNAFWYMWHEHKSKVSMVYGHADDLYLTTERFDVVIAGAVLEHLSDPISAIGLCARIAREAVILAFTPVDHEQRGEFMRPFAPFSNSRNAFVWWLLSADLYRTVLNSLGFDIEFVTAFADHLDENGALQHVPRDTIIARRRQPQ